MTAVCQLQKGELSVEMEVWTKNCLAQQSWNSAVLWKTLIPEQSSCPVDCIPVLSVFPLTCLRLSIPALTSVPSSLRWAAPGFHPTFPLYFTHSVFQALIGLKKKLLFRKSRVLLMLNFISNIFSIILWTKM